MPKSRKLGSTESLTWKSARGALRQAADPKKAEGSQRFFKTAPGQYGAGDRFLGISVPAVRAQVKKFSDLPHEDLARLLESSFNEERLLALLILNRQFEMGDAKEKKAIYRFYRKNLARINNWNLVDASAPNIIGAYLLLSSEERPWLEHWAESKDLWQRRIAIVSTLAFIRKGELGPTFKLAKKLISDREDLIHKATGWMLREAGKKDRSALSEFLTRMGSKLPRTTLRYAIERYSEPERKAWLKTSRAAV